MLKSLEAEHKRLMKELTKDPAYRAMITEIMKEPDLQKEFTKLLKTNEMRKLYKDLIIETGESPLVKAKMEDILKKAATKAVEKDKKAVRTNKAAPITRKRLIKNQPFSLLSYCNLFITFVAISSKILPIR